MGKPLSCNADVARMIVFRIKTAFDEARTCLVIYLIEIQGGRLMNYEEILPKLIDLSLVYGLLILKAVAIFVIGRLAAKVIASIVDKVMKRSKMDEMLRKFLRNIVYAVLLTFVVIASIGALGIQTASLVAILGAAGLAIGLALQGSLGNFAAGVLMIIFRPYKLGDLVCVADTEGFVEEVDVFTTTLRLPDRTKIIIPNGQIMDAKITNFTDAETRRLDLEVGIGYGDDIDHAKKVLLEAIIRNAVHAGGAGAQGHRRQSR